MNQNLFFPVFCKIFVHTKETFQNTVDSDYVYTFVALPVVRKNLQSLNFGTQQIRDIIQALSSQWHVCVCVCV
jgi:hypothetical protein